MKVLIPLPSKDFDPSEAAIPWKILRKEGHEVIFSTPSGQRAFGDPRMLTGQGLGPWKNILMANGDALQAYQEMEKSQEFLNPKSWVQLDAGDTHALLLPGGHAPGMKEYLESEKLQAVTSEFFAANKPVAAICHGVVLAARSRKKDGRSVLNRKKTTSLLKSQEMMAWAMTSLWLGNYYRTYPESVQAEVMRNLENSDQYVSGPMPIKRDSPASLSGFFVRDGNYLSARWPGDAHTFAHEFLQLLE
jgi:protease I